MNDRLRRETPEAIFNGRGDMQQPSSAAKAKTATAPLATVVHSLTVVRHVDVAFTNAIADGKLLTSTNLLKVKDGSCADDVACDVTMNRSGAVSTFGAAGDKGDVVTSNAQLQVVFAVNGNFKVIDTLGYCAGTSGSFAGCGVMETKNAIVERTTADEYGRTNSGTTRAFPTGRVATRTSCTPPSRQRTP